MPGLADPWALLLLAVPLLAWRLPAARRAGGAAMTVPEGVALRLGLAPPAGGAASRTGFLAIGIWICLTLALAGPRTLEPTAALPVSGRDLVVALDLSGSMDREDVLIEGRTVSRLDAVKAVGAPFLRGRGGDRAALLIYGTKAYFATPQTFDVDAVARALETAELGIVGRATGIGEALGLATKRLRASEADARVVVLLSDGVNNAGPVKPRDAARLASRHGIRIHTIAFGPRDLADAGGERDAVDAATLEAIAALSGGRFFRVRSGGELAAVAAEIDRIEATGADGPSALAYRPLWIWPAGAALALALGLVAVEVRR